MYTCVRYCLLMGLSLTITAAVQADVPRDMSDQSVSYITRKSRELGLMQPGDMMILRKALRGSELSPDEQARFAHLCEQVANELGIELDGADPACARSQEIMSGTREPKPNQPLAPDGADQATPVTPGDIDLSFNDINNVNSINGGGNSVIFNDDVNMNGNSINNIGTLRGANNQLTIDAGNPPTPVALSEPSESPFNASSSLRALTYGADGFLYAGTSGNTVYKIDPTDMSSVDTFGASAGVRALTYGADGFLYAGTSGNTVYKIDPTDMSSVATFTAGNGVLALTYGADGFLYAGASGSTVYKIDPTDMSSVATFNASSSVYALIYGADGFLYVGIRRGSLIMPTVYKVDPTDMSQLDTFTITGNSVRALTYGADGFLYGTIDTTVYKIDSTAMGQVATFTAGNVVFSLTYGSDGFLYVGSGGDTVYKINPKDMSQEDTFTASDSVFALTYGADGFLYAGTDANTVQKITTFDIQGELNITGIAPVSDLKDYQMLVITNDGTEVRRTQNTVDNFLQVEVSSRRYKRDMTRMHNTYQRLFDLAPTEFRFVGDKDDGNLHYGVIAEEIAQIMPELVRYDEHGQPESVRYIEMVPLLVRIIQDQCQQLEQQNEQMEQQNKRIEQLEQQNERID